MTALLRQDGDVTITTPQGDTITSKETGNLNDSFISFAPPVVENNLIDVETHGMVDFRMGSMQRPTSQFVVRGIHPELNALEGRRGVGVLFESKLDTTWLSDLSPTLYNARELRSMVGVVTSVSTALTPFEDVAETTVTMQVGRYMFTTVEHVAGNPGDPQASPPVPASAAMDADVAALGTFFDYATKLRLAGGRVNTTTAKSTTLPAQLFREADKRINTGAATVDTNVWDAHKGTVATPYAITGVIIALGTAKEA